MIKVDLCDQCSDDQWFLILAAPTGIEYANQVGGTACLRKCLEGYLVPMEMGFGSVARFPLEGVADDLGIETRHTAERVFESARFFNMPLSAFLSVVPGEAISEAWIPVKVSGAFPGNPGIPVGAHGFLTYGNSD